VTDDSGVRWRPELVAAFVNASVVALLPPVALFAAMFFFPGASATTTVHADETFAGNAWRAIEFFVVAQMFLAPFALLAGWRTWVHARRYCRGLGTGWQGVVEGGAAGFVRSMIVLLPGIVTRPTEALPYIIVYGGGATILGLVCGSFLWLSAMVTLRMLGVRFAAVAA
jgi:hypothetical protein